MPQSAPLSTSKAPTPKTLTSKAPKTQKITKTYKATSPEPLARNIYSDIYQYILKKTTHDPCNICSSTEIPYGCQFWKGITMDPSIIPECSKCKEDTDTAKLLFKEGDQIKFEPKCFTCCIWWQWADMDRRRKIGCTHAADTCECIIYDINHDKQRPTAAVASTVASTAATTTSHTVNQNKKRT